MIVLPIKLKILITADVIPLAKFSTLPSSTAPLIASAMSVDKVSVSISPIVWNIVANKFSIADTALLNLELSMPWIAVLIVVTTPEAIESNVSLLPIPEAITSKARLSKPAILLPISSAPPSPNNLSTAPSMKSFILLPKPS